MSVVLPSPGFSDSGYLPPAIVAREDPRLGSGHLASGVLVNTAHAETQPVEEHPSAQAGAVLPSVNGALYNRILIEPTEISVGNLVSDIVREVRVWNGYLTSKDITGFQVTDADGIAVTEPVAIPYSMKPLEMLSYIVAVSTEGPATISAQMNWLIDGRVYAVPITGQRIVMLPVVPDWRNGVDETLEWRTNIMRSYSGLEQRVTVRPKPRRQFVFRFSERGAHAARLRNALLGWQDRMFAMPVWTDKAALREDIPAGSLSVPVTPGDYSFANAGLLVIMRDRRTYEVAQIETAGADITLVRPLASNWRAGDLVYPVVLGRVPNSVPLRQLTSAVLEGQITFMCDPVSTDPFLPDAAAPESYASVELFRRKPNWINGVSLTHEADYTVVDNDSGAWNLYLAPDRTQTRRYGWLLKTRQDIAAFRAFLGRRRGRARAVYIPTWADDFRLLAVAASTESRLLVEDNGFAGMVGTKPGYDRILLRDRTGAAYARQITGTESGPGGVWLWLDQPLGVTIAPDDVLGLHHLPLMRLATDSITLKWHTDQVAVVEASFTVVKR